MRLTLRTMLAYLDDILEPDDHADIGKKIEESDFAGELVHRMRDSMRRLRLSAPRVTGRGMGVDPNTVAEYLDNTLPAERVAEFEKVCLESDVHLAEVAACHQVLTLVLGQPAEVDPVSRERMYGVPALHEKLERERAEQAHVAVPAPKTAAVDAPRPAAPPQTERRRREVPDYLRESERSSWKPYFVAACLAALVGAGVLAFTDYRPTALLGGGDQPPAVAPDEPFAPGGDAGLDAAGLIDGTGGLDEPGGPIGPAAGPDGAPPAVDLEPRLSDADVGPPLGEGPSVDLLPALPAAGADRSAAGPGDGAAPVDPLPPPPAELPPAAVPLPPDAAPGGAVPAPDGVAAAPPAAVPPPAVPLPAVSPPVGPLPPVPLPDVPAPPDAAPPAGPPAPADELAVAGIPAVGPPAAGPPPADAPPAGPEPLGVYLADNNILARFDATSGQWFRLPPRSTVSSGDRLLALPTFRPSITLSAGVNMPLSGGTSVLLGGTEGGPAPSIELLFGRMVLVGVGRAGSQVRLRLGGAEHVVTLADPDATLAVELTRTLQPGADPQAKAAPAAVDIYVASGRVGWHDGQQSRELAAPTRWRIAAGGLAGIEGEQAFPEWINVEPVSPVERRAALALEPLLSPERPVELSLSELVDGRRSEVRALAARASVFVGQFEPFVAALNDSDQRAVWPLHIDTLRGAMALDPSVAENVRDAFSRRRGDDGPELYRLLWSFSNEQLEAGADRKLVEHLDHERLDFRVLAIWNLRTITGRGHNYRPEYSAARRQMSIRRWEELLEDGLIRHPGRAEPPAGG